MTHRKSKRAGAKFRKGERYLFTMEVTLVRRIAGSKLWAVFPRTFAHEKDLRPLTKRERGGQ